MPCNCAQWTMPWTSPCILSSHKGGGNYELGSSPPSNFTWSVKPKKYLPWNRYVVHFVLHWGIAAWVFSNTDILDILKYHALYQVHHHHPENKPDNLVTMQILAETPPPNVNQLSELIKLFHIKCCYSCRMFPHVQCPLHAWNPPDVCLANPTLQRLSKICPEIHFATTEPTVPKVFYLCLCMHVLACMYTHVQHVFLITSADMFISGVDFNTIILLSK